MDHFVHVIEVVLLAACADVALLVPVASDVAVVGGEEEVVPEVKFTAVVEERLDVFLDYQWTEFRASRSLSIQQCDQRRSFDYLYTVPSIGILSRFNDPHPLRISIVLNEFLETCTRIRTIKAISLRKNIERIALEYLLIVPGHDLEQNPLGSDDAVQRDVVTDLIDLSLREA
jgi:hypothetical protein